MFTGVPTWIWIFYYWCLILTNLWNVLIYVCVNHHTRVMKNKYSGEGMGLADTKRNISHCPFPETLVILYILTPFFKLQLRMVVLSCVSRRGMANGLHLIYWLESFNKWLIRVCIIKDHETCIDQKLLAWLQLTNNGHKEWQDVSHTTSQLDILQYTKTERWCPHKNLHTNIYSSFIYNGQNLEATKMSFSGWVNNWLFIVHADNEILFST